MENDPRTIRSDGHVTQPPDAGHQLNLISATTIST